MAGVAREIHNVSLGGQVADLDVHLLPGDQTADYFKDLWLTFKEYDATGKLIEYRTLSPNLLSPSDGTTVKYSVNFALAPGDTFASDGSFNSRGVSFDGGTAVIKVNNPLDRSRAIRNFLLTATVVTTNASPPPNVKATTTFTYHRRIHVHHSVQRIWLSPPELTVRPAFASQPWAQRFTTLAEMDNGLIVDISNWWGEMPARKVLRWTTVPFPAPNAGVVPDTGEIVTTSTGGPTLVRVDFGGLSATGKVFVAEPVRSGATADLIAGDPGAINERSNVLFLCDGFTENEKSQFEELTEYVVEQFRNLMILEPLPTLSGSMNFWRCFLPSREAGINCFSEVVVFPDESVNQVGPAVDPKGATNLDRHHLKHVIGYPTPADATKDSDALRAELAAVFSIAPAFLTPDFEGWKLLAKRKLLNTRDTVFRSNFGTRPSPQDDGHFTSVRLGMPDFYFDEFLANIRASGGNAPLNFGKTSKDRRLVCMILRAGEVRENAPHNFFFCSISTGSLRVAQNSANPAFDLLPDKLPRAKDEPLKQTLVAAHEFGHALGLGDEYGEKAAYTGDPTYIEQYPNITAAVTVQNPAMPSDIISGARIKWSSWPIARHAGALALPPVVSGDRVELTLKKGHGRRFFKGQRLRLRLAVLHPDTDKRRVYRAPKISVPLRLTADAVNDRLILDKEPDALVPGEVPIPQIAATFTPAEGALVYFPWLDNEDNEVPMMAPRVLVHLDTTEKPLNAEGSGTWVCGIDKEAVTDDVQWPETLSGSGWPCLKSLVVGLYDGGATYHCGVYHPTGFCMMRSQYKAATHSFLKAVVNLDFTDKRRFCPVCSYALIDYVDPSKHETFSAQYMFTYPK